MYAHCALSLLVICRWLTPAGLDLAESLLSLNPRLRPTAEQALRLPYFTQELPRPELPNV